jgi:hypothetical protein
MGPSWGRCCRRLVLNRPSHCSSSSSSSHQLLPPRAGQPALQQRGVAFKTYQPSVPGAGTSPSSVGPVRWSHWCWNLAATASTAVTTSSSAILAETPSACQPRSFAAQHVCMHAGCVACMRTLHPSGVKESAPLWSPNSSLFVHCCQCEPRFPPLACSAALPYAAHSLSWPMHICAVTCHALPCLALPCVLDNSGHGQAGCALCSSNLPDLSGCQNAWLVGWL